MMIDGTAALVWLGVALVFVAIEVATVDFTSLMFGGGALGGSVVALFGLSFSVQAIIAAVVAVGLMLTVRPYMHRRFSKGNNQLMGASAHLGRSAVVLERVSSTSGTVKLAGETWTARTSGDSIEHGQEVVVERIDGATAVVNTVPVANDLPFAAEG